MADIASGLLAGARLGHVYPLWYVKQAFLEIDNLDEAYGQYAASMGIENRPLTKKAIRQIRMAAVQSLAAMFEIAPGGETFTIDPPAVAGPGNHRPLSGVARSLYLGCFRNVQVRSRSALLEFDGEVLLDFEGDELTRMDDQLDLDPAIFRANNDTAWIIPSRSDAIRIPEAFTLLGPHTYAFGHWMWEYLPKYLQALLSHRMPNVPVLVDQGMPPPHRRALDLILPDGVNVIELSPWSSAIVERLWYAPTQMHMPLLEKMNSRFRWDYLTSPPQRFVPIIAEMNARVDRIVRAPIQPTERVFLARKPSQHRKMLNHEEIERIAAEHGFLVIYPDDLSFDEQIQLMRGARLIVGPEGSAMFLGFFARPGARVCILNHPHTAGLAIFNGLLGAIGLEVSALTGPAENVNEEFPHFVDYRIDAKDFEKFICNWCNSA